MSLIPENLWTGLTEEQIQIEKDKIKTLDIGDTYTSNDIILMISEELLAELSPQELVTFTKEEIDMMAAAEAESTELLE